ncbi:MAG: hypothetical protein ACRERD_27390 [Candidatus Binatia bacterium]
MSRKRVRKPLVTAVGAIFFVSALPGYASPKDDHWLEEQLAITDGVPFPVSNRGIEGSQGPKGPEFVGQGMTIEYDTYLDRQLRITDGTFE